MKKFPILQRLKEITTKIGNVGNTDLQTQVTTLNSNLNDKLVIEQKGIDNSDEIASGTTKRFEIPISKTGYTPIGIVGITGSGTTGIVVQEYYVYSSTIAYVYMRNVSGNSITPTNIQARILYSKNSN